jgi:uracil-DNA glycosylase
MPHLLSPYVNDWVAETHPEWRAAILDKNLPLRAAFNKAVEELAKLLASKKVTKEMIEKYGLAKFITPSPDNILNAFKVPGITKTQFVICGQDPYPTPGVAQGFCFSTKEKTVPESLKNIFAALVKSKAVDETPTNPDFELWTRQGWLINRYLTKHYDFEIDDDKIRCSATKDKKCHTFWADFTDLALSYLVEEKTKSPGHLAIMLWGEPAKKLAVPILAILAKKGKMIDQKYWLTRYEINLDTGKSIVDIMTWGHPSPLGPKDFPDCPHFAETNKIRQELNLPDIHWNTNHLQPVFVATDGNCPKNGKNPDKAAAGYYLPDKFMHIKQAGKTEAVKLERFEYALKEGKIVTTDTPAAITNNRVELLALCKAIHYILLLHIGMMPPVRIIVDSTYALNTAQLWIWQKKIKYGNNWLDKIDANKDLIVILANLLARLAVRYGGAMKSAQHQWNILIHPEAKKQDALHVEYDVYSRWPRLLIWHQASHTQLSSTATTFQRACHMVNDQADKACNSLM